jgi:hypothetical protein
VEATTRIFFDAGKSAGMQFCENLIAKNLSLGEFKQTTEKSHRILSGDAA